MQYLESYRLIRTLSWCCWIQGVLNPDLFVLHSWDNLGTEPLSLAESSRGEEVRAFLSDHHFHSHPPSMITLCYVSLCLGKHAQTRVRCQQRVAGQGQL